MTLQEFKILCVLSITLQSCADNVTKCHRLIYALKVNSGLVYMYQMFGRWLRKINHFVIFIL